MAANKGPHISCRRQDVSLLFAGLIFIGVLIAVIYATGEYPERKLKFILLLYVVKHYNINDICKVMEGRTSVAEVGFCEAPYYERKCYPHIY